MSKKELLSEKELLSPDEVLGRRKEAFQAYVQEDAAWLIDHLRGAIEDFGNEVAVTSAPNRASIRIECPLPKREWRDLKTTLEQVTPVFWKGGWVISAMGDGTLVLTPAEPNKRGVHV